MGGLDTDCTGATAGSLMGALLGAAAVAGKWVDPLIDTLYSALQGMNRSSITDLAKRSLQTARNSGVWG